MRAARRFRALAPTLLVLAALPACATTTLDAGDAAPARLLRPASSVTDVSLREVRGSALSRDPMRPLADVLQSVWPTTTRPDPRRLRPLGADAELGVYAGNLYLGDWDVVRSMRSGEVTRVQRLTPTEAYQRYGRAHANGALVVTFVGDRRR
jgi:hypothetical protein